MALCIKCKHPVANGGNRHPDGGCAITGKRGEHHAAKLRSKRHSRNGGDFYNMRGAPVADTGKPSASSKATGKGGKKKKAKA
jgi:hypothetical protein